MWKLQVLGGGTKEISGFSSQVLRFIVNNNKLCNAFTAEDQRFLVLEKSWKPYNPDFKDETPLGEKSQSIIFIITQQS